MRTLRRSVRLLLVAIVVVSTFVLVPSAGAVPTTWWVDIAEGDNANPGTRAEPLRTIDSGLSHAISGDTVMVMPGTYGVGVAQHFPILLPAGVSLRSLDGADETTIVGDGATDVVRIANPTTGTLIHGFTITDSGPAGGRGIVVARTGGGTLIGWPRIAECVIEGCGNVSSMGGGLFAEGVAGALAQPRIEYTTFTGNTADQGGGAYLGVDTNAVFFGCLFEENNAVRGGGLCSRTENGLMLFHSDFLNNNADYGGGVSVVDGGGEFTMYGGDVRYNSATSIGGGIQFSVSNPLFDGVAIQDNTANTGAGIHANSANPTFQNCLIAGNTAVTSGGATYNAHGQLSIYNCTVTDNTGPSWAGVFASDTLGGDAEIHNSIFRGNNSQDIWNASAITYTNTEDPNLAGDSNTSIANVIHTDPLFVDRPNDYRLTPDSPCIDAAHPSLMIAEDFFGHLRPFDGDGNGTAVNDMGYHEYYVPTLERIAGPDRYETAADLATSMWTSNKVAVLVSGENYPDALTAAGLAGQNGCPILLVRPDSLPAATLVAMVDLGTEEVILVGGPAAVKETVAIAIANAVGPVQRVYGADRYETAAEVARVLAAEEGVNFSKTALVARGDSFPDALALSPLSFKGSQYHDGLPILLTKPGVLSPATAGVIDELGIDHAYIAGGVSAVGASVKTALDAKLAANGGVASVRWSGADRYATAVAVAEGGVMQRWVRWDRVSVATGTNFPDALAGGARTGLGSGVIVLTNPNVLSPATESALEAHRSAIYGMTVLGGTSAVSPTTYTALQEALGL